MPDSPRPKHSTFTAPTSGPHGHILIELQELIVTRVRTKPCYGGKADLDLSDLAARLSPTEASTQP